MYRYLITHPKQAPFYCNWFDLENNYFEGATVYDFANHTYYNGKDWYDIEENHL